LHLIPFATCDKYMHFSNLMLSTGLINWSSPDAPKSKSLEPPWEVFLNVEPSEMDEFIDTSIFPSDNPIRLSDPQFLPLTDLQRLATWIIRSCKDRNMLSEHKFRWKGQPSIPIDFTIGCTTNEKDHLSNIDHKNYSDARMVDHDNCSDISMDHTNTGDDMIQEIEMPMSSIRKRQAENDTPTPRKAQKLAQ
jgi:hypothetical protein